IDVCIAVILYAVGRNDTDDSLVVASRKKRIAGVDTISFFPSHFFDEFGDVVTLVLAFLDDVEIRCSGYKHLDVVFVPQLRDILTHVFEQFLTFCVIGIKCVFNVLVLVMTDERKADLAAAVFDDVVLIPYFVCQMFSCLFDEHMNGVYLIHRELSLPQYFPIGRLCVIAILREDVVSADLFEMLADILLGMTRN